MCVKHMIIKEVVMNFRGRGNTGVVGKIGYNDINTVLMYAALFFNDAVVGTSSIC